jgi:ribonucleoside-triphosphate reductase
MQVSKEQVQAVSTKLIDDYVQQNDWRVNENSNVNYSFSGLLLHAAGSVIANYTLSLYPQQIADAHTNGDIHIHDLSMGIAGYCAGWSLRQLLKEGFNGVAGKIESNPPKHLSTALSQMVNFLGTLQNEWAGAMAFSSFDTYLAPFVRKDNLSYEEVKQFVQQFVFNLNVSSRWGGQTPFTNITLDWVVPEDMKKQKAIWNGQLLDETYADFQPEMDMINKAYLEVMTAGDSNGRIFTFPIPTYNITRDFKWDTENANLLFAMTAKYGIPYFQNFVNSELKPSDVRSMCCRLQMDLRELRTKTGGLFGSGESTGSVGVVTMNLARLGYLSSTRDEFFDRLATLMDYGYDSLELKRQIITENLEKGLFPYTKRYLGGFHNHFSTIGLNGMNEAIMNFMGADENITTEKGKAFAEEVLLFMRERLTQYQERSDHLYNLEATPAEGTGYRFARMDKKQFPDILAQGKEEPYYTNSTQLPVGYTQDIFEAFDLQDGLQTKYTGGTVLHGFIGEQIKDVEVCKKLVKKLAHSYHLPYFTITPTFSVCPTHGYIPGEHHICPICKAEIEAEQSRSEKQDETINQRGVANERAM